MLWREDGYGVCTEAAGINQRLLHVLTMVCYLLLMNGVQLSASLTVVCYSVLPGGRHEVMTASRTHCGVILSASLTVVRYVVL